MGKIVSNIEIINLAISKELDAYNLYMRMASWASDPQMKNFLEALANEELGHKARLELEVMKLGIVVPSSEEKELLEQVTDNADEPALDMDYKNALLFAIKKERSSLRLYITLAALTKNKVCRETLLTLAEDEAMHEVRFEVEYNVFMRKQK